MTPFLSFSGGRGRGQRSAQLLWALPTRHSASTSEDGGAIDPGRRGRLQSNLGLLIPPVKGLALILLAFLLPLGVYLIVLGALNRRRHPVLVSGTWDFIGL